MKRVLVTGAAGFIGSHLVESLLEQGTQVRAFVRYNSRNHWGWLEQVGQRDGLEIFTGDVRDFDSVMAASQGVDATFHLAALIGIPYSYQSPLAYIRTNVEGTYNVLQAARLLEIEKVVHTSTSEVYGTAQFVPITEEHPLVGQSPYSASKIGADQLAISYARSFSLPVVVLRPFNTYGPRQSARAVIPTIISQLFEGDGTVRLGAISPTRDFNYVADTVNAFIAAARSTAHGDAINAGSNFEVSIGQVAEIAASIIGKPLNILTDEQRLRPEKSEVNRLWAANAKAKRLLDWEPEHAGIDGFTRGLEKTIAWFADPSNRKHFKHDRYNV
jgi:dTDP-glucose 4,6-dehydratase